MRLVRGSDHRPPTGRHHLVGAILERRNASRCADLRVVLRRALRLFLLPAFPSRRILPLKTGQTFNPLLPLTSLSSPSALRARARARALIAYLFCRVYTYRSRDGISRVPFPTATTQYSYRSHGFTDDIDSSSSRVKMADSKSAKIGHFTLLATSVFRLLAASLSGITGMRISAR